MHYGAVLSVAQGGSGQQGGGGEGRELVGRASLPLIQAHVQGLGGGEIGHELPCRGKKSSELPGREGHIVGEGLPC